MSDKNRLKLKFPFFAEGEAEGAYAITALVLVVLAVVAVIALH